MNKAIIFLLDEDNDSRPLFKKMLQDYGYKVLLAVEEDNALERANDGLLKSDLMIINQPGKSELEMLDFGAYLLHKANLIIPVVAIARKYGEDLEGTIAQVTANEYIVYMEDGELFDLLSRLT